MEWFVIFSLIIGVIQISWATWISIRGLRELSQSRILLNFGQRRLTIGRVLLGLFLTSCNVFIGYEMIRGQLRMPVLQVQVLNLFLTVSYLCLLARFIANSIPQLGVFEGGMRVRLLFLFLYSPCYVPWNFIKQYQWLEMGRWDEQGRLILNPGHFQNTCLIPREFIPEIDTLLKTKCPLLTTLLDSSSPVVERPA